MRRRILPISAVAALLTVAALTGCSASGQAQSCQPLLGEGALSASVRVSGESAEKLNVTLARGIDALGAQRSAVHLASDRGTVVQAGSIVEANFAYVDATTGSVLETSPSYGTAVGDRMFLADATGGSITQGTFCAAAGDTLAITLSPDESASMGVEGSMVAVLQIVGVFPGRAEGPLRALPSGFPAVTNDHTGRPGLVLPPQQGPSETRSAVRIQGSGEPVTAKDMVIGHVLTVDWTGKELRNTWKTGPVNLRDEAQIAESTASYRPQITGVPIGSQLVVIEPAGDGLGERVSVIDILAVA